MAEDVYTLHKGQKIDLNKFRIEAVSDWQIQKDIKESELAMIDFLLAKGFIEKIELPKKQEKNKVAQKQEKRAIVNLTIKKSESDTERFINKLNYYLIDPRSSIEMASKLTESLKEISTPVTPEPAPVVNTEEQDDKAVILKMIAEKGGPTLKQIEQWKKEKGGVYTLVLSKDEIYLFTHLTVADYREVLEVLNKQTDPQSQLSVNEIVVAECCLWPVLDKVSIQKQKAGTIESLNKAIMLNSYFLSEQVIRQFTFVM